jgi:hypothetical protein
MAANWNPNQVPASGDKAWITNNGMYESNSCLEVEVRGSRPYHGGRSSKRSGTNPKLPITGY